MVMDIGKLFFYCVALFVAIKILSRITSRKRGTYTFTLNTSKRGNEWESENEHSRKFNSY